MPSFALHPINRITRSISSPNAVASQYQYLHTHHQPQSATPPRSRPNPDESSSSYHLAHHKVVQSNSSPQSPDSFSAHHRPDSVIMPRFNPFHFIHAVTNSTNPLTRPLHLSESNKPPSPFSSSSASSARDSLPPPSSFSRSSSYNAQKLHPNHRSSHAGTDLPPVSPVSSMYDSNSPENSADGSRISDDDSASARLSSSSASDSLDGNMFLRPRSTRENRLHSSEVRGPVVNANCPSRPQSHDLGPPVAHRRALFERPPSPSPEPVAPSVPLRSRESLLAEIAARGKVVDAFIANPQAPDQPKDGDLSHIPVGIPRVMSGQSLEIPRGKVEQLPIPRPVTPCQVPRPETPSRLPRPRVFIKPSPSRHSVVDPVALTQDAENGPGEVEFVTREIHRPHPMFPNHIPVETAAPTTTAEDEPAQEDFYFSDEEHVEEEVSDYQLGQLMAGAPTPSDMLSYKMRRAVSALRSISFQSQNPDDVETAWGQASSPDPAKEKSNPSAASSRLRRVCGRISSKNGVQDYECQSEADAHSASSYNSMYSAQRDRGMGGRDQLRGLIGVPLRGDPASRHRRSLWTGGKRDRQSPQTRAAELLLSNGQGLLAASSGVYETSNALTAVSPNDVFEVSDHARNNGNRYSVDKYVEFIHASAQREAKSRSTRSLRSRIVDRMFRRRW